MATGWPALAAQPASEFRFHRDDILGTSFDLTVVAPDQEKADAAAKAALDEIERLRKILSTYEPASEICRLTPAAGPVKCSPELLEVLDACDAWRFRSSGAFNSQLGDLIALWKDAGKANRLPDPAALADAVQRVSQPAWKIDKAAGTVTMTPGARPNVDALAKGYIIDKALAAARGAGTAVTGLMLDIGGDLRVWGAPGTPSAGPWVVGVADPKHPQENAPLLARLRMADGAVATSGHYARYVTIGGKPYSHILDPRTGRPVEAVAGASAVAPDATTADALATALCVLAPAEGLRLLKSVRGAEGLIIGADGKLHASPGWKSIEAPPTAADPPANKTGGGTTPAGANPDKTAAWPDGYQLKMSVTLVFRGARPYIAFWIETPDGKPVRTLTVWGKETKYLRKLTAWWGLAGDQKALVSAVTRATRPAGTYELVWDGKDDKGNSVPTGPYVLRAQVAQEKGAGAQLKGPIECGTKPASARMPGNNLIPAIGLAYGPGDAGK